MKRSRSTVSPSRRACAPNEARHVFAEQIAFLRECVRRLLDFRYIIGVVAISLRQRRTHVACGFALGFALCERHERSVEVAQLALAAGIRTAHRPTRRSASWNGDLRHAQASKPVPVRVDPRYDNAIGLIGRNG